jgi:iron complex transport system permease protein
MSAATNALSTVYPHLLLSIRDFQSGGFAGVSVRILLAPCIIIIIGMIISLLFANELSVLELGDTAANSLGLRVKRYRALFLLLAAALAGAAVSFSGLINFVGLLAPHIARMILPAAGKRAHIALSAILGANLILICDTIARTAFAPYELPVGILISFIGAPCFLWLIFRERGARYD